MADGTGEVGWEELSEDDQDFFRNPHVHTTTRADYQAPGFSDAEKAIAAIGRLNTQGARKALDELNIATWHLDRYSRPYPRTLVEDMRKTLSARLRGTTDIE